MAKYAIDKYPKGSYKGQKSDGKYIDGYLKQNIDILAKNIVNDMTFLGVISSSTLEVGTGKSVFVQHLGEYWTEAIKNFHGIDIPFNINHLVFKPWDLIERAFEVPKYSCIIVDEWDDAAYMSQLGMSLRRFFRKCRQLNLFIIVIIPNFFQLQKNYAISRSVFFIDVKFEGEFERGHFRFFNFDKKRELYIKGKREENYSVVHPDFEGRFIDGYAVGREAYLEAKRKDFEEDEAKNENKFLSPEKIRDKVIRNLYIKLNEKYGLTQGEYAEMHGMTRQRMNQILNEPIEVQVSQESKKVS